MSKIWIIKFEVQSNSRFSVFPLDMMRYDRCTPRTQSDVNDIVISENLALELEPKPITMVHYSHGFRRWQPTVDRWKSFGWEVVKVHPAYSM